MLVFDELKKNDPRLRTLAIGVLAGMLLLLAGLWNVQIRTSKRYSENLRNQSFRTVRIPALRGKITDASGETLAANTPSYNLNLYLDEMRKSFRAEYTLTVKEFTRQHGGRKPIRAEALQLEALARYRVASNVVHHLEGLLHEPIPLDARQYYDHYREKLALPFTVRGNLDLQQVALIEEASVNPPGLTLEIQPMRIYPQTNLAAHLLGYLKRDDSSVQGEDADFDYRLPDYKGEVGVEAVFDPDLRGIAGVKTVLVNNLNYRQSETVQSPAIPGKSLVLTIDLKLQRAADNALKAVAARFGHTRSAAVVLDCNNGDILALASSPGYDPNQFLRKLSAEEWERLNDPKFTPILNRATQGIYPPGSIFKIIVGLAALEAGVIDPKEIFRSAGYYQLGRRQIRDTAAAGDYDFRRALIKSSNSYFIEYGLRAGRDRLIDMGRQFWLGQPADLPTRQDQKGFFPTPEWIQVQRQHGRPWTDGDTANLCIGQGEIAVTPMQMALMTAAVANGGKLFAPRLVQRLEYRDPASGRLQVTTFPVHLRSELKVNPKNLQIIREAMLDDVEDSEGTGTLAAVPGLRIGGKTGTAQYPRARGMDHIVWFVSFAPYDNPLYAVVVMVESGASGGLTCAPAAGQIYREILKRERALKPAALAGSP